MNYYYFTTVENLMRSKDNSGIDTELDGLRMLWGMGIPRCGVTGSVLVPDLNIERAGLISSLRVFPEYSCRGMSSGRVIMLELGENAEHAFNAIKTLRSYHGGTNVVGRAVCAVIHDVSTAATMAINS
jgi:hypothetical protein